MSGLLGYLPYLGLLACPLMMLFCVFGMRKMGGASEAFPAGNVVAEEPLTERVGALQARMAQLQLEQASVADELAHVSALAAATAAADERPRDGAGVAGWKFDASI